MAGVTLDTNDLDAVTAKVAVTAGNGVSLYVFAKTGTSANYRVGLEASPDSGTSWLTLPGSLKEPGILNCNCVATDIRAKVLVAEGATSTVTIHLMGR